MAEDNISDLEHEPDTTFPPELFDRIIDYLWDNVHALAACGVTCRAFLPTARMHLFGKVDLRKASDTDRLKSILDASPDDSSGIGQYVRQLTIDSTTDEVLSDQSPAEEYWVDMLVPPLLKRLTMVEHLSLYCVNLGALQPQSFQTLLSFSSHIHTLKLKTATVIELLLTENPPPSTLRLLRMTRDLLQQRSIRAHSSSIKLTNLVIIGRYAIDAILPHILLQPPFELSLVSLDWSSHMSTKKGALLQRVLNRSASTLKSLGLDFGCMPRWTMIFPPVGEGTNKFPAVTFARCAQLAFVRIGCHKSPRLEAILDWVTDLLAALIGLPRLQWIEVCLPSPYNNFIDDIFALLTWSVVDPALVRLAEEHPQLAVTFTFSGSHNGRSEIQWLEAFVDGVKSRLPAFRAHSGGTRIGMAPWHELTEHAAHWQHVEWLA